MNNSPPPMNDAVTDLSPSHLGTPKRINGGNEEENSCTGENKRRKSNGKATPRRKGSKNSTPKKNVISPNGMASPDSAQKIDLRLEAKLSAEENSRMYAGRQIHPFFWPLKSGKKSQKLADSGSSLCTVKKEDKRITSGPIHVFETIQDDNSSLDWRDWTFLGETTITNCGPQSSNSSVLEDSVESLNFDNLRSSLISEKSLPCSDQLSIMPENAAMLANEQTICPQMLEDSKLDLELDEIGTFSGQVSIFRRSGDEPLSRFLQESMRSYYHSCEDKTEGSLWTHKYKPKKAFEVCGNDESVNFLRDWLHLWHERRYQSKKDSSIKDQCDMQNNDYNCSDSDYDSEDCNEKDSLLNVLLITGPIGSGKSAAVYACAQEQGFEVLELNASDCRNGVAVKQYFGDALGSRGFKRSLKHHVSSQQKTVELPPGPALPNCKAIEEMDDGMIEMITISDDEAHSPRRLHGENNVFTCYNAQTLILVEDVDILFPEDRGCIAAIQRIAETAKGPIILTSNSNNPGLPYNLDRLSVSFSLPSLDELLCHLYTVCVTEEVNINPLLLQKFIQSCNRDIRKTIMHLQFWFLSKKYSEDKKVQTVYGSLPFDLEAGHQILPKIIPWSFPSELSKLIEKEVAKSITIMEEKSFLQGLVETELYINEKQNDLNVQCMATDCLEAEKVEMIDMNRSITDCSEFESQYDATSQLSNCSGLPVAFSWQKGQSNSVLMSTNSRDEDPNNGHSLDVHEKQNDLYVQCMATDCLEAEKVEMIDMNRSITDCSEFESQYDATSQLSNFSGLPVASSWQKGQSNSVLMSSNSRDEDPNNGHSLDVHEKQNDLDVQCMATDCLEAEKVEMIDMNRYITDCSEFESQYDAISQLSNCSGLPVASSWQKGQSNSVLMSSNSRDEAPNNGHSLDVHDEAYKRQSFEGNGEYPFNFQLNQSYNSTPFRKLVFSGLEESEQEQCQYFLETADDTFLNETCNLKHACLNDVFTVDVSTVPESIFVPETAIENGIERMSGAVSSDHIAGPVEVSPNNELTPFTFSVCERLAKLSQKSDLLVNTEIPESSAKAVVHGFRDENMVYDVMDECNHADFKLKSSTFAESSPSMETDVVQNLWRKLRDGQMDLRQHATSEQLGATEVVKLASGMSNLISESDLLFRNHQQKQCGIMEPPMDLSDEATISWYDEQMMMSTIALHGFCFYAKLISDVGSKLGYENRVDLASEIFASTTNVMALGKLSRQDHTKRINKNIYTRKQLEVDTARNYTKRENKTFLFNVIQSIVPARLSLALKGIAFNEYLSSLRQISVSEGIRISQDIEKKRGRRVRGSQHYLSRGKIMLSPEDISLVCEGDLYRKISSQYTVTWKATQHE